MFLNEVSGKKSESLRETSEYTDCKKITEIFSVVTHLGNRHPICVISDFWAFSEIFAKTVDKNRFLNLGCLTR
jgi:hypothetical protein